FPDRWILTNGYANRVRPPESVEKLSPNLGIQSAVIAACSIHKIGDPHCWQRTLYKQIMDRWTEDLDCVFIYDYDPGNSLANLPFPALHNLKHDIPYFHDRGVWGFWTEGDQHLDGDPSQLLHPIQTGVGRDRGCPRARPGLLRKIL
ncbi:MAG: hypothetical protein KC931_26175, partial [Candidatus Omnitrophica bacterium]|nr:hypothetical protein [Candidatus Omnitrophota bacterium]